MRSEAMQKFVDGIAKEMFGRSNSEAQAEQVCVMCGQTAKEFRDELSVKEYRMSGMCQDCQDGFFGV